jgi:phosphopantothenoylcysteine decarboxylase/phosphopantothenate--cysteine ligase
VAALPKPPFCVGFAAESQDLAENAKAKLAKKKLPLIAANIAADTMGRDDNAITLYDAKGEHPLGHGPKLDLARRLIEHVAQKLK